MTESDHCSYVKTARGGFAAGYSNYCFFFSAFRGWQQKAKEHDTEKHRNRNGSRDEKSYGSTAKSRIH